MAIDHIVIDTSKRGGQKLQAFMDSLRQTLSLLDDLQNTASHCQDGTTYTQVETDLGVASGNGQPVWVMLDDLHTKLNTDGQITGLASSIKVLTGRVG